MLVVLEGCDGSGKSTLAKGLAQILGAEVIHCSTHTPNTYTFFKDIIEVSKHKNIIADRFCYGQFVYQDEDNRWMEEEGLKKIEVLMLEANASVVFVKADVDEIKARLKGRGEELINGLTIEQVQERFEQVFNKSMLPVQTWWTSNGGYGNDTV